MLTRHRRESFKKQVENTDQLRKVLKAAEAGAAVLAEVDAWEQLSESPWERMQGP